ncbi:hypothetical protein A2U01_0112230, partial [Trifolium medium]|nr:hypothetical protein [Trifolium medium]
CFILLSTILTGGTSNNKFSLNWMSSGVITCDGSEIYFLNCDTWNTS